MIGTWPGDHRGIVVVDAGHPAKPARQIVAGDVTSECSWASISKVAVALCIVSCVEDGIVMLDDVVASNGATLFDLLCHAGGISGASTEVAYPPRQRRIYSNGGYELAATHLERATGMACATLLNDAVFEPLSMNRTSLEGSPASGVRGPLIDLARLLNELVVPTEIDAEIVNLMRRVASPGLAGVLPGFGRFDPCDWGLGPEVKGSKHPHWTGRSFGARTFGHFGQAGGFVVVDPEVALGVATLGDAPFGPWAKEEWPALLDAIRASSELAGR